MVASIEDRFWAKVSAPSRHDCWTWTGGRGRGGYGNIQRRVGSRRWAVRAHRLSWELHFGPVPAGLWVLHRCDNPPCVNPDHLWLGTRLDNMRDAGRKGRTCRIGKSRMTHCIRGHEFTAANTYRDGNGHRRCETCRVAASLVRRAAVDRLDAEGK